MPRKSVVTLVGKGEQTHKPYKRRKRRDFTPFDFAMPQQREFWAKFERRKQRAAKAKPLPEDGVSRAEYEERREQFLRWAAVEADAEPYRSRAEARARRRVTETTIAIYRDLEEAMRVGDRVLVFVALKVLGHLRRADYEGGSYRSPPDYASDIHRLESRGAKRKGFRRAKTGKGPVAKIGPFKDEDADMGVADALGPVQQGVNPIARETWDLMGFRAHMDLPFFDQELGEVVEFFVSPEDRKLAERISAKSPGRKRGRPRKQRKVENPK
jgi:hypothetical protein